MSVSCSKDSTEIGRQLDRYFVQVDHLLLRRQDPVTGLFPASTAVTVHGDYTDAWVRDNVYSIQAVWGLALAYRKAGVDDSRASLLEQSVVSLMRGLLQAMMRQAAKVERFKQTQNPLDALHAKYNTRTGDVVVADDKWGHLQLDATSIYLLMLAQMTRAGLRLVFNLDEVAFVQNLVHYIGRAYRIPDYGIWERGNKINNGRPEINASSVGMAKAALESMCGLDLFGTDGDARSTIYVVADEIARARAALHALLPRESLSKEVDAALLSVIGYPAFAVEDEHLAAHTRAQIVSKLAGPYGLKRFLLDGHQTVMEDHSRLHYEADELKHFANIECEWPLFYCYLLLDALFRGATAEAETYRAKLRSLTIEKEGFGLLPELYYVPAAALEAERAAPGSQERLPNHNVPLVWAQSLYLLGELIADGLLAGHDLDPLRRHCRRKQSYSPVQVAIVAENDDIKALLAAASIVSQTVDEWPGIRFAEAEDLSRILREVGRSEKLGLSGRPSRRIRSLATAQAYQVGDQLHLFFGQFQNPDRFYLAFDSHHLWAQLCAEISYVARNWDQPGLPFLLFKLRAESLSNDGAEALISALKELQTGHCAGISVALVELSVLLADVRPVELALSAQIDLPSQTTSASVQRHFLPFDVSASRMPLPASVPTKPMFAEAIQQLVSTQSLPLQLRLLQTLANHYGLDEDSGLGAGEPASLRDLLEELYAKAVGMGHWAAIRLAAGLLDKAHDGLEDAVTELVTWQRNVVFGRAVASNAVVAAPLQNNKAHDLIRRHTGSDPRECLLNQEVLVNLAMMVRAKPALLHGMLSIRISHLVMLIVSQLAAERGLSQEDAFDQLCAQPPHTLFIRLQTLLQRKWEALARNERLPEPCNDRGIRKPVFLPSDDPSRSVEERDWQKWRVQVGVVGRTPDWFYVDMWHLLKHCDGIELSDGDEKPGVLEAKAVLGATTPGERAFALQCENVLNALADPAYRQLNVEALTALSAMFRANPDLILPEQLVLDTVLNHAVKLEWLAHHPLDGACFESAKAAAWEAFYLLPPHRVANAVIRAFCSLQQEVVTTAS